MDFQLTTDLNPLLNAKIEGHVKAILEQETGVSHVFNPGAIYVHQNSDLIAGSIFEVQGTSIWIDSLWVNPQFQKQGIGSRLIEQLSALGKAKKCEFLQLNTYFAAAFFQKIGFETMAIIPKWKYGLDCHFMRKAL